MPVSTLLACRIGVGRSRELVRNARLHASAPDEYVLHGVELRLDEAWVTPALRAAIYDGHYEELEARIVATTLSADDRVLEIGCGAGFVATLSARIAGDAVRCYEANPAMVTVARRTIERNNCTATVVGAILQRNPSSDNTAFYVHDDFWTSSLTPDVHAKTITVPVLDVVAELAAHAASYVIVDIEGAETELLIGEIPPSVRKLCVECHPNVSRPPDITAMLASLCEQGFNLAFDHTILPVLYFEREFSAGR